MSNMHFRLIQKYYPRAPVNIYNKIRRHQHNADFYHIDQKHGKFSSQSILHQSHRSVVHSLHSLHLRVTCRIRIRQHHLEKKVSSYLIKTNDSNENLTLLYPLLYLFFRQNVALKKVNSKYILKSTLTPQLHRKQLHNNMDRCQSWPSVVDGEKSKQEENMFYLNSVSVTILA